MSFVKPHILKSTTATRNMIPASYSAKITWNVSTEVTVSSIVFEKHLGNFFPTRITGKTIAYTGGGSDRTIRIRETTRTTTDIVSAPVWTGSILSTVGGFVVCTIVTDGAGYFSAGSSPMIKDTSVFTVPTVHNIVLSINGFYIV